MVLDLLVHIFISSKRSQSCHSAQSIDQYQSSGTTADIGRKSLCTILQGMETSAFDNIRALMIIEGNFVGSSCNLREERVKVVI